MSGSLHAGVAAALLLLLGACSADEPVVSPPSADGPTSSREQRQDSVRIVVEPRIRHAGSQVAFEIVNGSAHAIHFTEGCSRPSVERLEGSAAVRLATSILENIPDPTTLRAGGAIACRWDGRVWQDPELPGHRRFESYVESLPAPPGRYRLRLDWVREFADLDEPSRAQSTHSPVFELR